jgi:hypothetical protein
MADKCGHFAPFPVTRRKFADSRPGKTAALCAEESRDAVVLDTVSTIESLTTGMSRNIWQKISVLPK